MSRFAMKGERIQSRVWNVFASSLAGFSSFLICLASPQISYAYDSTSDATGSPFEAFESTFGENVARGTLSTYDQLFGTAIDLVTYIEKHISMELDPEIPRYNRRKHFGGWYNADPETNCWNTRAETLIRDSVPGTEIKFKEPNTCVVIRGEWHDPYSGGAFKLASAMQVDHVVPLKNAFDAGAYKWSTARRCHYANYLENSYHLRAVNGHENMTKGSKGPERYMPPNERFHCTYLADWMKIKAVWDLTVTPEEFAAITALFKERGCRVSDSRMSAAEFQRQRSASERPIARCVAFESGFTAFHGDTPNTLDDPSESGPASSTWPSTWH